MWWRKFARQNLLLILCIAQCALTGSGVQRHRQNQSHRAPPDKADRWRLHWREILEISISSYLCLSAVTYESYHPQLSRVPQLTPLFCAKFNRSQMLTFSYSPELCIEPVTSTLFTPMDFTAIVRGASQQLREVHLHMHHSKARQWIISN